MHATRPGHVIFLYLITLITLGTRFHVPKATKILVAVFWVATPRSDEVGYQSFGGPCCLHLQGEEYKL